MRVGRSSATLWGLAIAVLILSSEPAVMASVPPRNVDRNATEVALSRLGETRASDPCGGITSSELSAALGTKWAKGAGIDIDSQTLKMLNHREPVTDFRPPDYMVSAKSCDWPNETNLDGATLNITIWQRPLTEKQVTSAGVYGAFGLRPSQCNLDSTLNVGSWSIYQTVAPGCTPQLDAGTSVFVVDGKMSVWFTTSFVFSKTKVLPIAKELERNLS